MKALLLSLTLASVSILPAANAADLSSMSWEQVVSQAKSEGKVVWYNWFLQNDFRQQVKSFEDTYGIEVVIPEGSHDANLQKFLANSNRKNGDIDVLSLGGGDITKINAKKTLIGPLPSLLPNGNKLKYKIEGADSKGYGVAYWGNQTGIAYNPAFISKEQLPQSIADFDAYLAKNPEMLGFNTVNGGSGPALIESITKNIATDIHYQTDKPTKTTMAKLQPAWNWFNNNKGKYIITASNSDSITRLNSGEFAMVATWEDFLAGLQNKGEVSKNIKFYIPKLGMPGGGNIVVIPKNTQHPAASLLFVSWLTSAATQTAFNQRFGSAPQNPDADDSNALISIEERKNSTDWANQPLKESITNTFIKEVTLH
ncbi:extracellular solute-binding protein [Marinomonas sp.]|uniref:extracellular solute-binding protein n=1 Tax=Marinomonas sp. TaxID=1904862 RepID=UPI003BA933F2